MRRRLIIAYLALLGVSTLLRAGFFLLAENFDRPPTYRGTTGSPVVLLADAQDHWVNGEPLAGSHQVAEVVDGMDASAVVARDDGAPVHLVAFGTAGPAAIKLAASHPERIRSLTLVDADGVEEFDLLGDHLLNRVLRRAQVAAIEAVEWMTPHFFILDHMLDPAERRAQRLLSFDRRGIRAELARWNGPTAIFTTGHSRSERATAGEHHRLLPQSTLGAWAPDSLSAFLARVDAGTATTRATADPARLTAAALPFDPGGVTSADGMALVVVLLLLALTTLLSEDLACVTAGMLAARGSIPLLPAIVACYLGIIIGDQLLYLLGRSAGRALVTRIPVRWVLTPGRLDRACDWFRTNGMQVVLTSRFLPGTRFPVYVAAGILRGGFVRFAVWLMVIGAVWTPALVGLSYEATRRGRSTVEALPGATWAWALGLVVGGIVLMRGVLPLFTVEGRAALWARWRGWQGNR